MSHDDKKKQGGVHRRSFLKGVGLATAAGAAGAFPNLWLKNEAYAQTMGRGEVKHLIYIRLSGGFRFTAAFNGDAADRYNPWGLAQGLPEATQWGPSDLLSSASWLDGEDGAALANQYGMRSVTQLSDQIAMIPCVDHEPTSGSADGNHQTGLQRFATGYAGNGTGFFTMINYALRDVQPEDPEQVKLPAFVLGGGGMANGNGKYAGYRPPVLQNGFDGFGFDAAESLPQWARTMAQRLDQRRLDRAHPATRAPIDAYMQTREATARYAEIFTSETLQTNNGSDELIDGISNAQLEAIFGGGGTSRDIRLALRLFHFGCPAVYMNQGGYDMHSGEEEGLPGRIDSLNRLISGLEAALKIMTHPSGGTYWDHTLITFGSEFGRTTRGNKFNSARGSDHGGDYATRWMSMPFMGGVIDRAKMGGQTLGMTRKEDLEPLGKVYSYRSVLKTLMDSLGGDHSEFFPADEPFSDLFGG